MATPREGPLTLMTLPDNVFAHILSQKVLNAADLHSLACSCKGALRWCNVEAKRRVGALWNCNYSKQPSDPDDSPDGEWPVMTRELALKIAEGLVECSEEGERADFGPALDRMRPKWQHKWNSRPIKRPGDSWLRVYLCEDAYTANHDCFYAPPVPADTAMLRSLLSSHARVADVLKGLSPSDRAAVDGLCGIVSVEDRRFEADNIDDNLETSGFKSEAVFSLVEGGLLLRLKNKFRFEDYCFVGRIRLSFKDGSDIATAKTEYLARTEPPKIRLRSAWKTLKEHGDLDESVSLTALGAFLRAVLVCFDEMDYYGVAPADTDDLAEADARNSPTLRGWPSLFYAPYDKMVQVEQLFNFLRVEDAYAACAGRVDWKCVAQCVGLQESGESNPGRRGLHLGWLVNQPVLDVPMRCGELNARVLLGGDWTANDAGAGDDAESGDDDGGSNGDDGSDSSGF
eukprot:Opistho-1_new@53828